MQGDQAMNPIGAIILSATTLMVATVAARAQSPQDQSANQVIQAPFFLPDSQPNEPASHPLFTIAGIPAYVWAPVEPHYDANNDRNLAADPFWAG
jgi:hypothetical protein